MLRSVAGITTTPEDSMFDDPTLVGPWDALAARLSAGGVLRRWQVADRRLAEFDDVDALLQAWGDRDRTHELGAALVELAAADGGRDDDALLLLLHLLSGVVQRLATQLADLSPDITGIVVDELTCQIRTFRWRRREGGLVANVEKDTRRAVLAELRPSDRYHPDRVEQLTLDGVIYPAHRLAFTGPRDEDVDLADLLQWASASGVDAADLQLLLESEHARGRRGARSDARVAAAHGISRRTLLRRRSRALVALRHIAPAYLAAVA
ncbi:MAG TPA: hypothetical protein VFM74_06200 [Candidatus Limnocylindria bacterium]|nr:hypothetical protein [Candidatus Limnocylindria bacterium]